MSRRYLNLGSPYAHHPVNRDLVLWWLPLPQRPTGLIASDLCQLYDGTVSGGAALTSGFGFPFPAWQFSGSSFISNSVIGPDTATLFTTTGWFRHDSAPGSTVYVTTARWRIQRAGGFLDLTVPGVADNQFTNLSISNAGMWYFYAVKLSGTTTTGYLASIGSPLASQALSITAPTTGNSTFVLGDNSFGIAPAGQMTDARLYNRALSDADIGEIYKQGCLGHQNTLQRNRRRSARVPAAVVALVEEGLIHYRSVRW